MKRHPVVRLTRCTSCSVSAGHILVNAGYARLDDTAIADAANGLHMRHRNFEFINAAIVAFIIGSRAAVEVIAQASEESSVNYAYIGAPTAADRPQCAVHSLANAIEITSTSW
jgi:hypothetical protein